MTHIRTTSVSNIYEVHRRAKIELVFSFVGFFSRIASGTRRPLEPGMATALRGQVGPDIQRGPTGPNPAETRDVPCA